MSTSRDRDDFTYEQQNDRRLDELHSKIRSLRSVTTDIYDEAERGNTHLDETINTFASFRTSLSQSANRAARALGLRSNISQFRMILYVVGAIVLLWVLWKIFAWFWWRVPAH
ncbi:hypothetical protein DACRYDRAFT_64932 [Dacryopinax primogenitus]|uniref:t-SNARE coiled-coil homology domain-containing protein n=1 Tax=Dacryopinax primogenitus (strain DJM 731) TaxID=1858805 RepID=M5GCE9_DACPD|nr:uncharacterized protein DACRYDRAFT_64932 [Dacryopinax primogenitus]EJU03847.1 hypothetical protein DACRYDRAFT_64932 [Dacryopinax primogenitus]